MSEMRYWIALTLLTDIGPVRARKLLARFGTPEGIFRADLQQICSVDGVGMKKALRIKGFASWDLVSEQIQSLENKAIRVICLNDPEYPKLLRETEDSPFVLYVKGSFEAQDRYAIAIVGSRKPTHYGIAVTERISQELSCKGFTIVSGMARGIDSIAHRGALRAGGRTIAVLGSGLDIPYPPEHKNLFHDITESGCVVSEFPPGMLPLKENFPRRNRIISGLSTGVLVVEAERKSGTLITAEYALEQNREIFAIPGNVTSSHSAGTNTLIKKGAILVRNADDIVEELAPIVEGFIKLKDMIRPDITETEQELCHLLSSEPKQVDIISRESGLPTSRVLGILLGLELKGTVRQITGKRFYLA